MQEPYSTFTSHTCICLCTQVAEFGARYGVWTVRAIKALQQLRPTAQYVTLAVEADPWNVAAGKAHCAKNNVCMHAHTHARMPIHMDLLAHAQVECTFKQAFVDGDYNRHSHFRPETGHTTIETLISEIGPKVIGTPLSPYFHPSEAGDLPPGWRSAP